ncbi:MAG: hybrid sensor histidine kinase/response regulator [Prolixibacteraceae bacterium]|nr:hybrid sensor histidine kinase/response regulator [Prolixibacteraceae bacterium]
MVETPTILVVDDNPDNIKIIALILRSLHYKIVIATSGAQAIEMVEHTHPDLILLDVMMPHLDGFETSRIIKSKPEYENIPIIFITALNDTESLVKGFQAGGVDYITKPFNRDELISRMRTHIDLKQTRDKLESATKHLEQLNTLKDTMFSVIGHDLRSPLSSVKMTLEFLAAMACFDNHKISESIHLMLKTTDEVFNLLENLLAWAKSQSNNIQINKEKLCTADLVNNLYFLNKGTLEQKRIAFHQEIETGHFLNADLNTLKVVLRNLLSNAIKFTPENGSVTIKALYVEGKSRIIVSDTGIGISETDLPKLLNPSQHHTTYGTNNESGSGLGLLLCKDFMEKNGGVISVESKLGKGTNFILDLPMSENL